MSFIFNEETLYFTDFGGDFIMEKLKKVKNTEAWVWYKNCDSKNKNVAVSNFTIENLYQYTDIALFLTSSNGEDITLENALKKVSISNIEFTKSPTLGTPRSIF